MTDTDEPDRRPLEFKIKEVPVELQIHGDLEIGGGWHYTVSNAAGDRRLTSITFLNRDDAAAAMGMAKVALLASLTFDPVALDGLTDNELAQALGVFLAEIDHRLARVDGGGHLTDPDAS